MPYLGFGGRFYDKMLLPHLKMLGRAVDFER